MLLGSVEEREKYRERETGEGGKKMSAFVIASHNGKLTNDSGEDYERERDRYEDVLGKTYYNLMVGWYECNDKWTSVTTEQADWLTLNWLK